MFKWTHSSKSHRVGYDWWYKNLDDLNELTISHEVYSMPEGGFENITHNGAPYDFAATSHAIQAKGGIKQQWQCPVVGADRKDLKISSARMGKFTKYDEGKSEEVEERLRFYDGKSMEVEEWLR